MPIPPDSFISACSDHAISIDAAKMEQLQQFVAHLMEINMQMNLTAVRDPDEVWMRHIFDALLLLPGLKEEPGQRGMDLGSGGGIPGFPLAILRPDIQWTLVDSVAKKVRFLQESAHILDMQNVQAVQGRAETLGHMPGHREAYHLVTARAVARLPVLLEYTVPFLKKNGRLAAMKGQQAGKELKEATVAIDRLGVSLLRRQDQPGGGQVLWFKKRKSTPEKYPRPVGLPAQKPLGAPRAERRPASP